MNANSLPITRNLSLAYATSLVIALLEAVASAAGIFYPSTLYPTEALQRSFVLTDIMNLVIGLPLLLGSMWLARRGKLIGLLCWQGMLFYFLYICLPYLLGLPFNVLFLVYLAVVTSSAFTFLGVATSIDGNAVRQELAESVPARTSGAILAGLAIFIIVRQVALVVAALTSGSAVPAEETALWIADLAVACPVLLIVGIQLWRHQAMGYVACGGLLLAYGVLSLGVIPLFVIESVASQSTPDIASIVVLLMMAALCFVPFGFFVRGAVRKTGVPHPPLAAHG